MLLKKNNLSKDQNSRLRSKWHKFIAVNCVIISTAVWSSGTFPFGDENCARTRNLPLLLLRLFQTTYIMVAKRYQEIN